MIFDIENWLWKSDLGTFWRPIWMASFSFGKTEVDSGKIVCMVLYNFFSLHDFIAIIESCWILVFSGKENKVRVTRMIIIVIAIFAVCWFPTQLILLLKGIFYAKYQKNPLSRSAHRTPNFANPEFQFLQFKVLQSVFFLFDITSCIGNFGSILISV